MTAKELAAALSGREYGMEIMPEEERDAKDAGLVVVYGYSDDNIEIRGAIDAEVGAYDGTTIYFNESGLLNVPDCDDIEGCECPYFAQAKKTAKTIDAVWCKGEAPWTFETDIPHETFTVIEDGEIFCVGIVFNMDSLAKQHNEPLTPAAAAVPDWAEHLQARFNKIE